MIIITTIFEDYLSELLGDMKCMYKTKCSLKTAFLSALLFIFHEAPA